MNTDEMHMQKECFYVKTKLYALRQFDKWDTNVCYLISCKILWEISYKI